MPLKKLKQFLPKKNDHRLKQIFFWFLTITIGLISLGMITFASAIIILSIGLPNVTDLENLAAAESTEIFDREGNLLYTIHGEENREVVSIENISPQLINATIALEDGSFWEHKGFDIFALGKATLYEIFKIGTPRGGSTLTQQYVKNAFLSAERSYTRKAKELILAMRMERAFEKEKILELYLNRIPYGNNAYGIQRAAEIYFAKNAVDLNLAESVVLASLPQAPSRLNPYGDNRYSRLNKEFTIEEIENRKITSIDDLNSSEYTRGVIGKLIKLPNQQDLYIPGRTDINLMLMHRQDMITREEWQKTLDQLQELEFNQNFSKFQHPHFVLYIKQILETKYGKDVVEKGGLKVYTTIDQELQKTAEESVSSVGATNLTRFGADNAAALTINAKTGEILAMVGSRDYFDEEIDGNVNIVFRKRQPGSSFKPLVYAQAFLNGYAPGNIIYDVPTKIGPDQPQNYDGKWQGQISIRTALGKSRNIPAIKAYYLAGQQAEIIKLSQKIGITSLDPGHDYGYPLALGAGEISLAEMVTAYATFANGGKTPELSGILRIENSNGDILEEWQPKELPQTLDPQVAFLINSILSDETASVGPRLFVKGKVVAGKTGTSTKENKNEAGGSRVRPSDAWTIGYTPSIVTGVWAGNTNGLGMGFNANGYDTAGPIYNAIMQKALANRPNEPFPQPENIKKITISKASGKLPSQITPEEMITSDYFASFAYPSEVENIFSEVKIDKISGLLATEYTPEDAIEKVIYQNLTPIAPMLNWSAEIIDFYKKESNQETKGNIRIGLPPTEYDNIHTKETALKAPSIVITNPLTQSRVSEGNLKIEVQLNAENGVEVVEYYIDDQRKFFTSTAPYTGSILISRFYEDGKNVLLVAKVIDKLGYSAKSAIEVTIDNSQE